jgi:hypothetical protein
MVSSDENSNLIMLTHTKSSSGQTVSDVGTHATHPSQSPDGTRHAAAVPSDAMREDIFSNVNKSPMQIHIALTNRINLAYSFSFQYKRYCRKLMKDG